MRYHIRVNARAFAIATAAGRFGLGVALLLSPRSFGRRWIGADADRAGASTAIRATGARDAALGLGLLVAYRRGRPVRGWLEAAALTDAADFVSTLMAFRKLPALGRLITLASAGGAAYFAMRVAGDVDEPELDLADYAV